MLYQSAAALRAAIDARLKRYAAEHGQAALARTRKHIVFDRFLARLMSVSCGEWTLKGGVALDYRLGDKARATRDLDLLFTSNPETLDEELAKVEAVDLGDYFSLSIRRTSRLNALTDGSAIRYHLQADLDGRTFEKFIVDIGFDVQQQPATEPVWRPGFLEFAGLVSSEFPALAIEIHLAEKLHAYSRPYSGDRQSSRVKDMVDIVLIGQSFTLNAATCVSAIHQTFASRNTHPVPDRFAAPPANWVSTYPALAMSISLEPDIAVGHAFATRFMEPLLVGDVDHAEMWDFSSETWHAK